VCQSGELQKRDLNAGAEGPYLWSHTHPSKVSERREAQMGGRALRAPGARSPLRSTFATLLSRREKIGKSARKGQSIPGAVPGNSWIQKSTPGCQVDL